MRQLSGGMKRRLMVAKAMVHNPPVLITSTKPTAGVDVEPRRHQLWDYVIGAGLNPAGRHHPPHHPHPGGGRGGLCDTIAIVNHGAVVACEPTAKLLTRLDTRSWSR